MATTTTNPKPGVTLSLPGQGIPAWPQTPPHITAAIETLHGDQKATRRDALQALLAFSALHEQVRRRKSLAAGSARFENSNEHAGSEFAHEEQLVLDEVLQLVAERAVAITGADGLAIALAENNEIVLRASSGLIKPDIGARIDRDSAFSGACFRMAQVVRCDDTETDDRVNLQACRRLGVRSMVAVPLCGRRRVIGVLEAFSSDPFGFNDDDVRSLSLLAEVVLGALKPEDEDRFAEAAQAAAPALEIAPATLEVAACITSSTDPLFAPTPNVEVDEENNLAVVATTNSLSTPLTSEVEEAVEEWPGTQEEAVAAENFFVDRPSGEISTSVRELSLTIASSEQHRPGVLFLLGLIVAASLLGVGLWWKLKTMQLGSAMVGTGKIARTELTPSRSLSATQQSFQPAVPDVTNAATPVASGTENSVSSLPQTVKPEIAPTVEGQTNLPHLTGIRHWSSVDSSTVVLDLEDQVQYEAHRLANPDRIYFDLSDTALAPQLLGQTVEVADALLSRVRVAQPSAGMTRVVLETKGNSTFSVSLEPNPYRLVVEVRRNGASPKGAINLFPGVQAESNNLAIVVPPPTKEDLQLRSHIARMRIAVDAGHGGWDLGTVGRRGLLEKDVVLEVAERLGRLLESRLGAEVIYTRHDDSYIPLDERAGLANQAQADLFVSVHANYSDLPSARGVETYYTNFFSAPGAKDADTRAGGATDGKNATAALLSSADLHERIEQSRRLASSVQRSLYGALSLQNPGLRDRGVKEAGFVVLTETTMPGILAEVSFVSSPTDEQKLRSDGYREQIAEALYKGIARYASSTHGVKVASAGR